MSFFRTVPSIEDFSPLFHLLDDYDNHRSTKSQTSMYSFAPRFDVHETKDAYHLDGELPGIPQKDIDIEFTDPQTIVIKGRTEREYHSINNGNNNTKQPQAEGASSDVVQASGDKQVAKSTGTEKARYWVSERSVGEFQRTFSFPSRVSQDDVKASLKDGILSLVVPKAAPPSSKKIAIQ
ncbi:hypothetical protein BDV12DRAFT_178395 [Aspergillus spectabilis]